MEEKDNDIQEQDQNIAAKFDGLDTTEQKYEIYLTLIKSFDIEIVYTHASSV